MKRKHCLVKMMSYKQIKIKEVNTWQQEVSIAKKRKWPRLKNIVYKWNKLKVGKSLATWSYFFPHTSQNCYTLQLLLGYFHVIMHFMYRVYDNYTVYIATKHSGKFDFIVSLICTIIVWTTHLYHTHRLPTFDF